ncbi:MAG: hypothetical protein KJ067_14025 [Vicinamibacteria bacterium]|nr:hypothetical protein [Vicinamibacteria bacterium]
MNGQAQRGIDLLVQLKDEGVWVGQCKGFHKISPAAIQKASKEFLKHRAFWERRSARRFVLLVACEVTRTELLDAITVQRRLFRKYNLDYEVWDANELATRLEPHRTVAAKFLPTEWVDRLCGVPAGNHPLLVTSAGTPGAFILAQFEAVGGVIDHDTQLEGDRVRELANQGRPEDALAMLRTIEATSARWSLLRPETRARLLRIEAAILMAWKRDHQTGGALLEEADALEPTNTATAVHAQWAELVRGPEEALLLLAGQEGPPERSARARLLIELHRPAEALVVLETQGEGHKPDAEIHRWRALAHLSTGDLAAAAFEAQRAAELAPSWAATRFTAAMIDYLMALSPVARTPLMAPWPHPVRWEFVRRDDAATLRARRAERVFGELLLLPDLGLDDRRDLQAWRLACLAVDPEQVSAAKQLCRLLVDADPLHCPALLWALVRGWRVDLRRHAEALEGMTHTREATIVEWLTLVALHHRLDRAERALSLLDLGHGAFKNSGNESLWRYWRTQLLLAVGRGDEAAVLLATGPGDQVDPSRALVLLAEARRSNSYEAYAKYCARIYAESGEGAHLLEACQVLAQVGRWELVMRHIEFLQVVATLDSVRLAAVAAWNTNASDRCLALLDQARGLSSSGQLTPELRGLRVQCLKRLGHLSEASAEAEALAHDEPTTKHLVNLVHVLTSKLDTKNAAVVGRRLVGRADLSPRDLLGLAAVTQPEDVEMARSFWRQALESDLTDAEVASAFYLGSRLSVGTELKAVAPRLAEAAKRGTVVRTASLDDLRAFLEERRDDSTRLDGLYRRAEAPLHFIAHESSLPLVYPYHQSLAERSPGTPEGMLLARWGGRPPVTGYPDSPGDVRLYADVTSLILAGHLGILDAVEATFLPIRLAPSAAGALLAMRNDLLPGQPERLAAAQEVQDLVSRGRIGTVATEAPRAPTERVRSEASNQDETGRGSRDGAGAEGVVVDFTASITEHVEAGATLNSRVNCGAIVRALRQAGAFTASQVDDALARLGVEGEGHEGAPEIQRNTRVHLRPGTAQLLAIAGSLTPAAEVFKLRVLTSDYDECRAAAAIGRQCEAVRNWLDGLIDRLRAGIEVGRYQVLPVAPEPPPGSVGPRPAADALVQLLTAPHTPGDVLWVDDRAIGKLSGQWPVGSVSTCEVLAALRHFRALDDRRYFETLLRLRREGVYFLPLDSSELLQHLSEPVIRDGALVETAELTALRRYVARAFESGLLRFPAPGSPNEPSEHPFVLTTLHAVEAALVEVWKSDRPREEREAIGEWLWTSFGIHEIQGLPLGSSGPQGELLSVRLAALVGLAFGFSVEERAKRDEYLAWLDAYLVAPRVAVDPALAGSVADTLRRTLESVAKGRPGDEPLVRRAVRSVPAELIEHLPPAVADELRRDSSLARALGQKVTAMVSFGKWSFPHPEVWLAAATAARQGSAPVTTLDGQAGTIKVDVVARPVVLEVAIGLETFTVNDALNSLLLSSVEERRRGLDDRRSWLDCDNRAYAAMAAEVASMDSPGDRIDAVLSWGQRSTAVAYERLRERIRSDRALHWADTEPSPDASLLGRLRLPGEGSWAEAITAGTETLLREEGVATALARLAALPSSLPGVLADTIAGRPLDERRSILLDFSKTAVSPVARFHAIRALVSEGGPECEAEATRHASFLATDGLLSCRAFLGLLAWSWDDLSRRENALEGTRRLACAWAHAHEVYSILSQEGAPDDWIASLRSRRPPSPSTVFGEGQTARQDLASPNQCDDATLLLFGLAWAVDGRPDISSILAEDAQRSLADALTMAVEPGKRLPKLPLLRDRTLALNSLDAFLQWGPAVDQLLPADWIENLQPERLAAWRRGLLETLATDPGQVEAWIHLAWIVADLRIQDARQGEQLATAIRALDFARVVEGPEESGSGFIVLRFICSQVAQGGAADASDIVMGAIRSLAARWPDATALGRDLWLLFDSIGIASRRATAVESARFMSELLRKVADQWPSVAGEMRQMVQALADRLPLAESKELWPLLTHLRAVA